MVPLDEINGRKGRVLRGMDFTEAARRFDDLREYKRTGAITDQQFRTTVEQLRVLDSSGTWWQPDPNSGSWMRWDGTQWTAGQVPQPASGGISSPGAVPPGTPPVRSPSPGQQGTPSLDLMSFDDFKKIRTSMPWYKRPQKWWDLLSILGGVVAAVIWFLYGSIRSGMEGFDLISPILMIGMPVCMVMFRPQLDNMLMPLVPHRRKVPKLVLIGLGIAIPFLTAWILYNIFFISNYPLMQYNMVIGTFAAYAVTREPILGTEYKPAVKPNLKVPLFLLIFSWVIVRVVSADHCQQDPLNLQDCLRSGGYAEVLAGTSSAVVSTAINAPEIARNLLKPPAQGGETELVDGWARTPEEIAEALRQRAARERQIAEFNRDSEADRARHLAEMHQGMVQDPMTGDWITPEAAQQIARNRAEPAIRQAMEQRLENMEDGVTSGAYVTGTRADIEESAIQRLLQQLRSGGPIDIEQYNRIRSAYGNDVMGNTIRPWEIPQAGTDWSRILSDTVDSTTREILTGQDAGGKTSYSSLALRMLLGGVTAGQSEWVYTPGSSLLNMQAYVNAGGNSALQAFRQSGEQAVIQELMGRAIEGGANVAGNIGGRVLDNLAERYPGAAGLIEKNLNDVSSFLTRERHLGGGAASTERAAGTDIAGAASSEPQGTAGAASREAESSAGAASGEPQGTAGQASSAAGGTPGGKTPAEIEQLKNDIKQRIKNYQDERGGVQQLSASMETTRSNLSPADVARRGITESEQAAIKKVSQDNNVIIDVRGREPRAAELIKNNQAVPKGEDVHVKTVKDVEIEHLGYDPATKDYVVCRQPDPIPTSKPPDMSAREWRDLRTAHAQRSSEFTNEQNHLQDLVNQQKIIWDPKGNGVVYDKATGLPLTSDIDGFMIRNAANPNLLAPPDIQQKVVQSLIDQGVFKHGVHGNFPYTNLSRDVPSGSPGALSAFDTARKIDHGIINVARTANPEKGLISINGTTGTVNNVRYTGFTRNPNELPG